MPKYVAVLAHNSVHLFRRAGEEGQHSLVMVDEYYDDNEDDTVYFLGRPSYKYPVLKIRRIFHRKSDYGISQNVQNRYTKLESLHQMYSTNSIAVVCCKMMQ